MSSGRIKIIFLSLFVFFLALVILYLQFGSNFIETKVFWEEEKEINLDKEITINFSLPINKKDYVKNIKINPPAEATGEWKNDYKQLVIKPKNNWKAETNYEITLPAGKTFFFSEVKSQKLSFSTLKYPRVSKFFPPNGSIDIVLDIEDPMLVDFDKSVKNFDVRFLMNPEIEAIYDNGEVENQLKILPKAVLPAGQRYEIRVLIKAKEEKDYKEIYFSSFETLPLAPDKWEKDFTLRLGQAKRFTRAKILEGRYIDVNLTSQILSIFENGKIIDSFLISSGKRGMETSKGSFSIRNKHPRVWSKKYSLWMPYWMAVVPDGSFGIHELPEWPGGYKEGANHLGIPVSHGCIRLGVGPAKVVYDFSEVGTPVVIY